MAFIPPLNLGQFQPSPATLSQWVYQIWQFLQENPIATETEIRTYIESELTESTTLSTAIEDYLEENPPEAPVQSVQGKTGAVTLAYNDIVTSSNTIPVYKASSTPSTSTLVGQYNLGYRLFVNTATQEIYTISPAGALSRVGRGNFDGTTVDVDSSQGDTSIAEAINENRVEGGSGYCKLPDGTLINYKVVHAENVAMTSAWGSAYESTSAVEFGNWPQPFLNDSIVTSLIVSGTAATPEAHNGVTSTSAGRSYLYRPNSATGDVYIHIIGIGRWK